MNNQFKELVSKILLIDEKEVKIDLSQDDLEDWDSMTHLVLVSEVETEYDVKFTDDEVTEIQTIGDLVDLLTKYGKSID